MENTERFGDVAPLPAKYQRFYDRVCAFIPRKRLITDPLRTLAYGTDASFYRLIPKIVVKVRTTEEVHQILITAAELTIPVTFRAAGTSLSGQAVSDSVLLLLYGGWKNCRVQGEGSAITLEPGVIGAEANRHLQPYGKKIGPDPASINHAMIGGIAANNASGMCCGTADNSYKTVQDMKIILADGTMVDTGDASSVAAFQQTHQALITEVKKIRDEIFDDPDLNERIIHKFKIKNTTGYSLNALVDYDDPIEIIKHLMIGSEGTLGFIAEITYKTVIDYVHKASALVIFPDIEQACLAVMRLDREVVSAAELMDRRSLRAVEEKPGMPAYLKGLSETAAALLIEVTAETESALQSQIARTVEALQGIPTVRPITFTDVKNKYAQLWNIRKGLFPAVGAVRNNGTTVIIEDVAYPKERLAEAILDLRESLDRHGYPDSIIFGHALDGNVHFVFTQDFSTDKEVQRYDALMQEVCDMVAGEYGGSLKAEHGTGRNMAPFVEREWGKKAYRLMRQIKHLFDPEHILNPGVIIAENPKAHLENLKPLPPTHEIVDKCIECGFCEVNCPSQHLTLTPRQRITVQRAISGLRTSGREPERLHRLLQDYAYLGRETCAADGLCATTCPVAIDTGSHTKKLRAAAVSERAKSVSRFIAGHFAGVTKLVRVGLRGAHAAHSLIGAGAMQTVAQAARQLSGERLPLWNPWMPKAAPCIRQSPQEVSQMKRVVYFPACVSRTMGPARDDRDLRSLPEVTLSLLAKAGYEAILPAERERLCCGMPFESKGLFTEADGKSKELEQALLAYSWNGEIPVLCDTSPCLYRMKRVMDKALKLYEPVEFVYDYLLPHLAITPVEETVAIHVTCSATKMNLKDKFMALAQACARKVILPADVKCCGFAGDRGFSYPELNESALSTLKAALQGECASGYSNSRTCEIGLSLHSGISYQSILYLVDRCARPRE
ncbi:FAD-binding protein [Heliobacterium gestii]|uniref:D-lactate dehydrogenase (cytochrome) n=1 Tax=Heliomicrobium gestii TaxID=2699 RepID=A0A845LIH4_HELGE|nr:FAD-binding and (Fe-S)-binding domain-containing protein [Heliomicrobium gestii]MBM7867945.1 D-lactate dehydrogenase [Heliomicrobium gestii]MZP43243.1 FAD-binding protein [Heliomicrobium gestii]